MDTKILVISDLKESSKSALNTGASLAKIINGRLSFFSVCKPTEAREYY